MYSKSGPLNGKVLKLHFACRVELPYGSSLRITSSNLLGSTVGSGSAVSHSNGDGNDQDSDSERKSLYSSSVEMVTSPELYPLWRTKTPVITAVNGHSPEGTFCHRYRYLVVTPGAASTSGTGNMTSDGNDGLVNVAKWEDPFYAQTPGIGMQQRASGDLPFRSINVDLTSLDSEAVTTMSTDSVDEAERTDDGQRVDIFENEYDDSFELYRETMAELNVQEDEDVDPEEMMRDKRFFIVCYHLPVKLTKDESSGEYSAVFTESLIAKTECGSVTKSHETFWIGTVSMKAETDEEMEKIKEVLKPLNCMPLFLDDETVDSFYYGMCKQILWPAFHNIDLLDIAKSGWGTNKFVDKEGRMVTKVDVKWDQSRLDYWWHSFLTVNKRFADALIEVVGQDDIVWVHDYHLSLLPKLLHEAELAVRGKRTIEMIFFLHIPFPTSQVFRELERGEHILEGMLHADVVGFHAFDHARHFLNASKRILGLLHENLLGGLIGVRYRGTKVLVTISNVSIEADVVEQALNTKSIQDAAEKLQNAHLGRTIISGIDIAQGLSGVSLKLLAFEKLLHDYPNWRDKVVMIQICIIPSNRKSDEADTIAHVRYLVKRILKTFGNKVIKYEEVSGSSLSRDRRLALWLASEVFMAVPIREGLNLLPLEYVFSRKDQKMPGVTITSEFSAVCSILNGALRVNPFDIQSSSTSIDTALTMSLEERRSRRERDIKFVSSSSSGSWTRRVLRDLADVTMSTSREKSEDANSGPTSKMDSLSSVSNMKTYSVPLDVPAVIDAYKAAEKRVFFIDFNGTIVMKEPTGKYLKRDMQGAGGNRPPAETIKALIGLCADERNTVYVVSGDTEKNIENAIGHIEGIGLASGNGGSLSCPTFDKKAERKWETSNLGVDFDAVKRVALPILSKYTARANGSFIKLTSSSVGWSYYSCDPEWGNMLAKSIIEELEDNLHSFDVRLVTLQGVGVIEVVPRKLNKGLVVKEVLGSTDLPDFVLCIGDDVSDEKMFTSVFSVIAQSCAAGVDVPDHVFTVTVGKKFSNASYFVDDAADVADLLIRMDGGECSTGRAMSWDNEECGLTMFDS